MSGAASILSIQSFLLVVVCSVKNNPGQTSQGTKSPPDEYQLSFSAFYCYMYSFIILENVLKLASRVITVR